MNGNGIKSNDKDLKKRIYNKSLLSLGEMLKILKQGDNKENRDKLKRIFQDLSKASEKAEISIWQQLLEIAEIAIIDTNNSYVKTTQILIKEIKQGAENIFKNRENQLQISKELKALVPESYLKFMASRKNNQVKEIKAKQPEKQAEVDTVNRDLWKDSKNSFVNKYEQEANQTNQLLEELMNGEDSSAEENINQENNIIEDDFDIQSKSTQDWFEEGYINDDNNLQQDNSSAFINTQNNEESVNDINSLFDDLEEESDKEEIELMEEDEDSWDLLNELDAEITSTSGTQDWDLLDGIEGDDDNDNNDDLFDILDEIEDGNKDTNEKEEDVFNILDDFEDLDDLDDYINEIEDIEGGIETKIQSTTGIFVDSEKKITKETLWADDDDEIPMGVRLAREHQLLFSSPVMVYNDFTELEKIIDYDSNLENEKYLEVLNLFPEDSPLCYENFVDLESIIDSKINDDLIVNWQELSNFIDNQTSEEIKITEHKVTEVKNKQEKIVEQELSDLDQLLKEAQSSSTKLKWKGKKEATPVVTKQPFEQTMRVPVKQLDSLNNLVGEMVVRRSRLEQDQTRLRQFLDNLLGHVQNLTEVGAKMQDLYERSLLEGALLASREKNKAMVIEQLNRTQGSTNTPIGNQNKKDNDLGLDDLELDRFTGFHLLSQDIIELIVRVRESTSDIQFLVDETEQLGRNLRQVTTQLQEEINKSRMVAFAQTADRLPRAVRDISLSYGKEIELKVEGREVLIDKMILEHLWDPIQQLVKNSITHGVEVPKVRQKAGKSSTGVITIRTYIQGPQTVISVGDDGAGIDPEKVKKKAIENKLITSAQAANLSIQDVYDFLFHAGFSTKEKADSHAGRGVGLDIVRNKLNEIRGSVSIESNLGKGTTFTIRLPLTLSIGKALCCFNENARIAFPMDGIEDTKDYASKDIKINEKGEKCISWNNTLLPIRPLNTLITYNRQITRSLMYASAIEEEIIPIIILRGGHNLLAIQVDQVIGEEEIVIKQISGPLPKPKGIAGATVRSDGIVMPIGDVIELIEIAQGHLKVTPDDFPSQTMIGESFRAIPTKTKPLVLIVDDSITVREMLSISFNKSNYQVEQARDGEEAWQKLRSGLPCDIVFCDIEMPRMNGLELLQHIEADSSLCHIPVAILSSRGAEKMKKMVAELGASAYLIKPYVEKDLIDSAQRMLNGEVLLEGSLKQPKRNPTNPKNTESPINKTSRQPKHKEAPIVLIIDDSVVVREMLSMTFKKAGFQVKQARDGQDAWDQISEGLPCDIMLCDIEMPRMNGLELLAKIQQDEQLSKIPVAMVTSRGAEKHRKIAADLGAKAYFTKPYLEEELLEATNRLIKGDVLLTKV